MMNDDVMQAFATALNSKAREMAEAMAAKMVSASQADIDAAYERGLNEGRKLGYVKARREDLLRLQRSCPEAWDGTDAEFTDGPVSADSAERERVIVRVNSITRRQGVVLDAVVGAIECGMNGQLSTSQLATLCEVGTGDVANCLAALRKKGCISWTTPRGEKTLRVFAVDHERIAEMTRV